MSLDALVSLKKIVGNSPSARRPTLLRRYYRVHIWYVLYVDEVRTDILLFSNPKIRGVHNTMYVIDCTFTMTFA